MLTDEFIRNAAFSRVLELSRRFGGVVPWESVCDPLPLAGEEVRIANRARGIFRPRQMSRGVLSIKTTIPRTGRNSRYEDIASDDGFFLYRFQGQDPSSSDNVALRQAFEDQSPLIYFHGVAPGLYMPIFPVFVTQWNPKDLCVHVVPGEMRVGIRPVLHAGEDLRRYAVIEAKGRLIRRFFESWSSAPMAGAVRSPDFRKSDCFTRPTFFPT